MNRKAPPNKNSKNINFKKGEFPHMKDSYEMKDFYRKMAMYERLFEKSIAMQDPRRKRTKECLLKTAEIYGTITSAAQTIYYVMALTVSNDLAELGRPPPIFSQILITRIQI